MKVGILTMHKVINYGSALQAYALQRFLRDNGFENEIIDYLFSPRPQSVKDWIRYIVKCDFIKDIKFRRFWKKNYILSQKTIRKKCELSEKSCKYDIYLTGSDQVWNPNHQGDEQTFMFDFIKSPDKKIFSYASSFSTAKIPEDVFPIYKKLLSRYKAISVREETALPLIEQLTGKNGTWVCDPTLLLNKAEWSDLGNRSRLKLQKPYVLFYILTYTYNPYPYINHIITKIQDEFKGMRCVFLNGRFADRKRMNSIVINNIDPCDFVSLVANAHFVVTTSFHGTAFAINFRKPFYSIVQADIKLDDRMCSLLRKVGLEKRAVLYDRDFFFEKMDYDSSVESRISHFINDSKYFLEDTLNRMSSC